MLVLATSEVVRVMGVWVRRADAGLLEGAARNAATAVALLVPIATLTLVWASS